MSNYPEKQSIQEGTPKEQINPDQPKVKKYFQKFLHKVANPIRKRQ